MNEYNEYIGKNCTQAKEVYWKFSSFRDHPSALPCSPRIKLRISQLILSIRELLFMELLNFDIIYFK